jgi:hypothetical protein
VRAAIVRSNLERLVVGIAAEFAGSHGQYPVVGGLLVLPTSRKQKCRIWNCGAFLMRIVEPTHPGASTSLTQPGSSTLSIA